MAEKSVPLVVELSYVIVLLLSGFLIEVEDCALAELFTVVEAGQALQSDKSGLRSLTLLAGWVAGCKLPHLSSAI